ncbi:MAG TPA: adenylate/guanylate cyclase domain-containing protein [Acidimicrobiia bacterium]|nr:adenylate/guanylate cyclase domain-containing protein [Acidimicrobiia bacterium]
MDNSPRQLAAVWFADIAGYTSLANRDESAALRLVGIFNEVAREQIEDNGGTVVKFVGDGVLAYAPSVTSATGAVLSLREVFEERSAQTGIDAHLRIGMHLGDIAIGPDGDVFGDGVNIASRLETAAGPGRIYVSEDLWRQCRQRAELEFIPLGPRHLKGLENPVWVYELAPPATDPGSANDDAAGRNTTHSLAILPFDVLGSGDDPVFLAAGIHNDLLTELSKNPSLTVISRTSVMGYRQPAKSIPRIAHELNVGWIVEGAVQSVGNRVRLTVQLIDGTTDVHRWADYFDRELTTESLFEIQTELTQQISESLHGEFAQAGEAAGPATNSMEAYRLVTEGRMQFDRKTEAGLARARELFQRAVDLDPDYAPAWVGLTDSLAITADYGYGDRGSLLEAAHVAVERALELMPDSAEAHSSLGLIAEGEHDAPKALREYEKAMQLGPSYADAHSWHGWVSLVVGRAGPAFESVSRSVELNPLSAEAVSNLALSHLALRDPASAIVEARRAGELSPDFTTATYYEALARYDMGGFQEAVNILTPLSVAVAGELAVSWASMMPDAALALAQIRTGRPDAAREVLATIDAEVYPFEAAMVHAGMGDLQSAYELFGRAEHAPYGPALAFHHHFRDVWKDLRDDPRYHEIVDLVYRSWRTEPPGGDAPPSRDESG